MPNLLSAKRCQKRKIAPADQLKAVDDIDMPFTMSALETIINFGQILEIKTVTLIKKLGDIVRNSMARNEKEKITVTKETK